MFEEKLGQFDGTAKKFENLADSEIPEFLDMLIKLEYGLLDQQTSDAIIKFLKNNSSYQDDLDGIKITREKYKLNSYEAFIEDQEKRARSAFLILKNKIKEAAGLDRIMKALLGSSE